MEKQQYLKNAPITEALIDIRVKLPANIDINTIKDIHNSIKKQYPEEQEQRITKVEVGKKTATSLKSSDTSIIGYRYISSDKKQIVQARLDGFTFSRLHPYENWEVFCKEAQRLWNIYKTITTPELIPRIAVRYINNLKIQMPIKDFSDYLTSPPTVPEKLPQGVNSFLTRIVLQEPSIGANAIITQALEQIFTDVAPIILDIDVFKLEQQGIDEVKIWEILENLRKFKNKIFLNSITEDLMEMYK